MPPTKELRFATMKSFAPTNNPSKQESKKNLNSFILAISSVRPNRLTWYIFVTRVGKIKTASPKEGSEIAAEAPKIIIGMPKPIIPLINPATKQTVTKNKKVDVSNSRITLNINRK